jgi:L-lactate dehydrogenase complex protein LldG
MSREKILGAIHQNKPLYQPLPEMEIPAVQELDLVSLFCRSVEINGGKARPVDGYGALTALLTKRGKSQTKVVHALLLQEPGAYRPDKVKDFKSLESTDIAVIPGIIGVAENGAVWVDERCLPNRVLPFICKHLILVIQKYELVANMHQAYQRIKTDYTGFGVWIAGPSKTADIEQSLVIGAHGAIRHEVLVVT